MKINVITILFVALLCLGETVYADIVEDNYFPDGEFVTSTQSARSSYDLTDYGVTSADTIDSLQLLILFSCVVVDGNETDSFGRVKVNVSGTEVYNELLDFSQSDLFLRGLDILRYLNDDLSFDIETIFETTASGFLWVSGGWGCEYSTPVPEPTTVVLFSCGIAGLACIGRRNFNKELRHIV